MQPETGGASLRIHVLFTRLWPLGRKHVFLRKAGFVKRTGLAVGCWEDVSCESPNVRATYIKVLKAISIQCSPHRECTLYVCVQTLDGSL